MPIDDGMAMLGPKSSPTTEYVVFQFNPGAIVISHTAPMQQSNGRRTQQDHGGQAGNASGGGSGGGGAGTSGTGTAGSSATFSSVDEVAKANGVTSITLRSVTFDGANAADSCERLLSWTYPADVRQTTARQDVPELKFIWGRTYPVNLNQVTINYTRFSRTGKPVRALVDLTLHSVPGGSLVTPTNPSSGGMSGRRTHLLTGAETLPELSTQTYGEPGRWREIATANGIADPLRVRPGALLYLPSEQEGGG